MENFPLSSTIAHRLETERMLQLKQPPLSQICCSNDIAASIL